MAITCNYHLLKNKNLAMGTGYLEDNTANQKYY
jgi:hypothetical protein